MNSRMTICDLGFVNNVEFVIWYNLENKPIAVEYLHIFSIERNTMEKLLNVKVKMIFENELVCYF